MQWSPSPSFSNPHATSESQISLMDVGPDVSLSLSDGCSNGFGEAFASGHMHAAFVAPKPQAVLHAQPVPDLSLGFSYHRANLCTEFDHASFQTSNTLASSLSSGSTQGVTNFVSNERQLLNPVVIYRPPERKGSGRRRCQRACAIDVQGLWIDKDDLNFGADHDSSMISVHECQWAASGNPCGMWIIPSRPSVGNHIRKWHTRQRHANSTVKCLWYGCDEAMHKDSINRHVVTVHFGEAFHCQGCDQEFPRKDVYNQHVEDGEACKVAGATMVYGTEHRAIDKRQALHRGGTVRYGR
ncbi:hypothetical protein OG21DRAFT_519301 [Imleria badia]|nr:hypothetical protein OG21DRAFT_519301 [Imleria badia]